MFRDPIQGVLIGMVAAAGLWSMTACMPGDRGEEIPDLPFHQARHALYQGRWDWARVYLEQDVEANPDHVESVRDLGVAWISGSGGGLAQGIPFFERYLAMRPNDQETRRRLVNTLIRLSYFDRGLEWAEGFDDHPDAHYLWALLLASNDPGEALDHLERSIAVDEAHSGAYALAARLREEGGELELARVLSARAIAIDPFNSKNRARYERLLKKTGHREQAAFELRALEIVSRLNQSRDAGQLEPVEELHLVRELKERGSGGGFVFDRRFAEALLRSGRIQEGVQIVDRITADSRFSVEDGLVLARILSGVGERKRARELYENILASDPTNVTARSSLAILDLAAGLQAEALKSMEEALIRDPYVATYHAVMAQARMLSGDDEAALIGFETGLKLAPWEDQWRAALADLLRARGKGVRAKALLAEAPSPGDIGLPIHGGQSVDVDADRIERPQKPETEEMVSSVAGWWKDISAETGLDFVQYDGRSGRRYYVETTASGGGFFDFDDDGDLDIYLMTGAPTPGSGPVETPRNALFENQDGHFVDVTEEAGVGDTTFSMGMCVGDIDGDGLLDMMVANYGPDSLYRNLGGGRFEEMGTRAGVDDPRWSSNCAFGDVDGDGDLDLYVSHYLDAGFENNPFCGDRARDISAYCRPSVFPGVSDSLFINSGDGTFSAEGESRGLLQGVLEKGFGVVMTDLDDDGDLDIFVANDSTPNRLYVNDGGGFFEESGLVSGVGLNSEGMPTSGMGVDIGDVDGDLKQDLVLTNFAMESNGLYQNLGDLVFEDVSRSKGLSSASMPQVGWGARLADFDNDGDLDLAIANGHVVDNIEIFEPDNTYGQRNRLLFNDGEGAFVDVSGEAGDVWRVARVSRALTIGDWNSDGRLDLLIANSNDRFELLENQSGNTNNWLGLRLVGKDENSAAIGARVVATAGDRSMMREVRSGTGFQSQGDLRLHFGLGNFDGSVSLDIRWPDGSQQVESVDDLNHYLVIKQRP